jgi:hypothetical protein
VDQNLNPHSSSSDLGLAREKWLTSAHRCHHWYSDDFITGHTARDISVSSDRTIDKAYFALAISRRRNVTVT